MLNDIKCNEKFLSAVFIALNIVCYSCYLLLQFDDAINIWDKT